MVEKIFLTETRREVLDGSTDLTGQSLTNERSRIRVRSRMALDELIEVAESSEIDNSDVFDPDDVFRLVRALLSPDEAVPIGEEPSEEFQAYEDRLHVQLDKVLRLRHSRPDS